MKIENDIDLRKFLFCKSGFSGYLCNFYMKSFVQAFVRYIKVLGFEEPVLQNKKIISDKICTSSKIQPYKMIEI